MLVLLKDISFNKLLKKTRIALSVAAPQETYPTYFGSVQRFLFLGLFG